MITIQSIDYTNNIIINMENSEINIDDEKEEEEGQSVAFIERHRS